MATWVYGSHRDCANTLSRISIIVTTSDDHENDENYTNPNQNMKLSHLYFIILVGSIPMLGYIPTSRILLYFRIIATKSYRSWLKCQGSFRIPKKTKIKGFTPQ